jgi:hypothetical protein
MQWVKDKGFAARLLGIGQSGRRWLKKRGSFEPTHRNDDPRTQLVQIKIS